ncbi:hypothetical protein RUM43_013722 [Polyplax serrata]|uniref:Uncharacterized protein n=1 Tax=Polyplax serrata TaxID=468196 RepID=A0AAN8S742_POLSC
MSDKPEETSKKETPHGEASANNVEEEKLEEEEKKKEEDTTEEGDYVKKVVQTFGEVQKNEDVRSEGGKSGEEDREVLRYGDEQVLKSVKRDLGVIVIGEKTKRLSDREETDVIQVERKGKCDSGTEEEEEEDVPPALPPRPPRPRQPCTCSCGFQPTNTNEERTERRK